VVIHHLEFANVPVFLHHAEKFDDDFGGRPDEDLALAALFGIDNRREAVVLKASASEHPE
jgi:hypothetical protein